jgi:hypothetical protein
MGHLTLEDVLQVRKFSKLPTKPGPAELHKGRVSMRLKNWGLDISPWELGVRIVIQPKWTV